MPTPLIATGVRTIAAFVRNPSPQNGAGTLGWGQGLAVQAGAGDGIELNSDSMKADSQYIENMQIGAGSASQSPGVKGNELHSGSIDMDAYFQGCETLMSKAFGFATAPALTGGSATVYKHVYKPLNDLTGIFGTLVLDSGTACREWPYVKVGGFTFTMENGKESKLVFDLVPQALNLNQGTAAPAAVVASVLPAAGALTIVGGSPYNPVDQFGNIQPMQLTATLTVGSSAITAFTATVVGTNRDGVQKTIVYTNPVLSAGPLTFTSVDYWRTIASITIGTITGATTGASWTWGVTPGVNSSATTGSVSLTASTARSFVTFAGLHVWVNPQASGALTGVIGGADEIFIKAMEIKADVKLLKNNVTTRFGFIIEEPQRNGFLEVTIKLAFAEWVNPDNHQLLRQFLAKDLQKLRAQIVGPVIDSSVQPNLAAEWDFYANNIAWKSATDPNIKGPGVIPWDVVGKCQRAAAAPTGFPAGYTDNLTMEMYNLRSTQAL